MWRIVVYNQYKSQGFQCAGNKKNGTGTCNNQAFLDRKLSEVKNLGRIFIQQYFVMPYLYFDHDIGRGSVLNPKKTRTEKKYERV